MADPYISLSALVLSCATAENNTDDDRLRELLRLLRMRITMQASLIDKLGARLESAKRALEDDLP